MSLSTSDLHIPKEYRDKGYEEGYSRQSGYYIKWSPLVDEKLGINCDWEEIFRSHGEPVTYSSSHKFTGESTDQEQYNEFYEDTGYIIPRFRIQASNEYSHTLEYLGISSENKVLLDKLGTINQYQQLLYRQVQRQLDAIKSIHKEIADVLKVIICDYAEFRQLKTINATILDGFELTAQLRACYASIVNDLDEFSDYGEELDRILKGSSDSEPKIKRSVQGGVGILLDKRLPIIEIARQLAGRLNAVESIIEDILLNNKLKPSWVFQKRYKPHKDEVYKYFWRLKENRDMSIKDAFFKVKRALEKRGWNPEDYQMGEETEFLSFGKAARDWKNAQLRKNSSYK